MDDAPRDTTSTDEITRLRTLLADREQEVARHLDTVSRYASTIARHESTIATLTQQRDEYYVEKLRLEVRLAQALKQAYGPRADRVGDAAQRVLDFVQQLQALPIETGNVPAADKAPTRRLRARGRRDIGSLDHLPMIEKKHELTGERRLCPTCQKDRARIGEEISYTVDYIPATLVRIKHIQGKYACGACEREGFNPNIERAEKTGASPIDKGMPGPGLLAHVATAKYGDYLPLHRLEVMFAREGFELDRSTMCLWMADVARIVKPLYDRMVRRALQSHVLATDDTVMPLLQPGRTRKARMWVYLGDEDHPYNVFDFTPTRNRDGPKSFLKNFRQTLLADAYGGYDGIVLDQDLPRAGCWAHARRKFVDAEPAAPDMARNLLARIKGLFDVEERAKDLSHADRLRLRQAESRPIIDALHATLVAQKEALLPKHPLALAIAYTLNQWKELTLFLGDGAVPIHNNLAEQQMKRIALLRKNALFVATPRGGETAAVLSSLTSTCRRHDINPQVYLTQLLANLLDTPITRLDEWLPDEWKKRNAPDPGAAAPPPNHNHEQT
jgi:transposase